jgi:cytochrome c oxidase assembly protein subunit 15
MSDSPPDRPNVPRWLHAWAILTACLALPLAALGAEVTTKQVGMADTTSVRAPWYLATLASGELWAQGPGLIIEHSHRTAGWLVGMAAIVLALGMWFGARGTGLRLAGLLGLALVIAQGLLGIFRVSLNGRVGPEMAMVHGLFAQIVFATLVGIAVVTSRSWRRVLPHLESPAIRRLAAVLAIATYLQIVFGALVRHQHSPHAQRAHALFAFAVVAAVVWLAREVWQESADTSIRRAAGILVGLVAIQVALGVESWLRRFGAGVPVETLPPNIVSDLVRSAHFLVGALLFATTLAMNLLVNRPRAVVATDTSPAITTTAGTDYARIGGVL